MTYVFVVHAAALATAKDLYLHQIVSFIIPLTLGISADRSCGWDPPFHTVSESKHCSGSFRQDKFQSPSGHVSWNSPTAPWSSVTMLSAEWRMH